MKENRPRFLVVDDLADGADSLGALLELWGYEAKVAYDGPSALEAAQGFGPHVVLLDICMPGVDGFRLAEALRGLPGAAGAALVAVTGRADEGCRARARGAGFAGYLVKPVEPDRMRDLLAALLGRGAVHPAGLLDAVEGARAQSPEVGGAPFAASVAEGPWPAPEPATWPARVGPTC